MYLVLSSVLLSDFGPRMFAQQSLLKVCTLVVCLCLQSLPAFSQTAEQLFQRYQDSVLQVQVVDISSGSKFTIGSGFLVEDGDTIATNYHVISSYIRKPGQYSIELLHRGERYTEVEVRDVDVVNDLALLSWHDGSGEPLHLASIAPAQGSAIYAFGNPRDIGLTVVPGTYNGVNYYDFYQRIHLTGSINPGMSGGPTLNRVGEVVGINVSTAGNQISFLVPVDKLQLLLAEQTYRSPGEDLQQRIKQQLMDSQARMYELVVFSDWLPDQLGKGQIYAEIVPFVRCWGDTDTGGTDIEMISKGCQSGNYIHLDKTLTTGFFEYEFVYMKAKAADSVLDAWRFYNRLEYAFGGARPGNRVGKGDVTGFNCHNSTLSYTPEGGQPTRMRSYTCVRQYKDYPQLYDLFYIAATIDRNDEALMSHFTLSGVEKPLALAFIDKFVGGMGWK